jgi:hypothetical protein
LNRFASSFVFLNLKLESSLDVNNWKTGYIIFYIKFYLRDGDVLGKDDIAVFFLIRDGEFSSSGESGINSVSLS